MVNQAVIDWVKQAKIKGYSDEQLTEALERQGYSTNDINVLQTITSNEISSQTRNLESTNTINSQQTIQKKKSKTMIFIAAGIVITLCLFAVFFFSVLSSGDKDVFVLETTINTFTAQEKEIIMFEVNEQKHKVEVEEITETSATFTISSDSQTLTLQIGESRSIDLNGDGINEIILTLLNINEGVPEFTMQLIEQENDNNREERTVTTETESNETNNSMESENANINDVENETIISDVIMNLENNTENHSMYSNNMDDNSSKINDIEKDESINIEFSLEKEKYLVEEFFSPNQEIKIQYSGEPSHKKTLIVFSKKGIDSQKYKSFDVVFNESLDSQIIHLYAFELNEAGVFRYGISSFPEAGEYLYEVRVYDCEDIRSETNQDCSSVSDESVYVLSPLAQDELVIYIHSAESESENKTLTCSSATDCDDNDPSTVDVCWNNACTHSILTCTYDDGICEPGCEGQDNDCCETVTDCEDYDISTTNACEEGICTYTAITTCENNDGYCPEGCDGASDNDCGEPSDEVLDCGEGEVPNACFIQAARDCQPAFFLTVYDDNYSGTHKVSYRKIQGIEKIDYEDYCMVYQRLDEFTVNLPQEDYDYLKNEEGLSDEDIEAHLADYYPELSHVGDEGVCGTDPDWYYSDLEDEADGWDTMNIQEQAEEYDCSGELYTFT